MRGISSSSTNLGLFIVYSRIKMIDVLKEAHTAIFSGQTGCGKTHLILNLLESK